MIPCYLLLCISTDEKLNFLSSRSLTPKPKPPSFDPLPSNVSPIHTILIRPRSMTPMTLPPQRQNQHMMPTPLSLLLPNERHGTSEKTDRKSTRLNSSHQIISYAVFCLKK